MDAFGYKRGESDPMFGMSFANVNIERIFLYFHYEFVKRDFG